MHFALVGRRDCHRVELCHLSSHLNPCPQTNTGGDAQEESLCQSRAPRQVGDSRKSTSPPQARGSSSRNSEEWLRQALGSWVTYTHQCIRHGAGTRNGSTPGTIVLRLHVTCSKQKRYMYPSEHLSSSATEQQRPKRDMETLSVGPGVKVTGSISVKQQLTAPRATHLTKANYTRQRADNCQFVVKL